MAEIKRHESERRGSRIRRRPEADKDDRKTEVRL